MPKDAWAATRRRDAVRRANSGKSWSSRPATKGKKKNRCNKIAAKIRATQQIHAKHLGSAKPIKVGKSPRTIEIQAGSLVDIRRTGEDWKSHVMQRTLQLVPRGQSEGRHVFWFKGWQIRGPRPNGS